MMLQIFFSTSSRGLFFAIIYRKKEYKLLSKFSPDVIKLTPVKGFRSRKWKKYDT